MRGLLRRIQVSPLGGSPAVLAGLVVWNAGNYAFFVLVGRWVGPEEYGTVAALLAATLLVLVPSGAIQVAVSRRVAELGPDGAELAAALFRRTLRWAVVVGLALAGVGFVIAAVAIPSISTGALAFTAASVAPMGAFSMALGSLQGQHRFGAFGMGLASLGAPRPVVFAILALGVAGVVAAMGATAVTLVVAAAFTILMARPRDVAVVALPAREWSSFRRIIGPFAVGLSGVAVLLNLDVIVARAALPDRTAGHFGAVAVLAKAVTLVPQTVSWVLLPRVARSQSNGQATGPLLGLGVIVTLAAGVLLSLLTLFIGRPVVELAFGSDYGDGGRLLAPLIAVSTLTGLLMVLLNYQMARGLHGFAWAIGGLAIVEVGLFMAFHASTATILWVEALVGVAGIAIHETLYRKGDGGLVRGVIEILRDGHDRTWKASAK